MTTLTGLDNDTAGQMGTPGAQLCHHGGLNDNLSGQTTTPWPQLQRGGSNVAVGSPILRALGNTWVWDLEQTLPLLHFLYEFFNLYFMYLGTKRDYPLLEKLIHLFSYDLCVIPWAEIGQNNEGEIVFEIRQKFLLSKGLDQIR